MKKIWFISILLGLGSIYAYPQDSIVSIPDVAFLNALIEEGVDTNKDGEISYEEAALVTTLYADNKEIKDITGIEAFVNMVHLRCFWNSITSLDFSNNPALLSLNCGYNQLTSLDISNNPALKEMFCEENQLSNLDVSNNPALEWIYCSNNLLTNLDVSNNPALTGLFCNENQLTNLDVKSNTELGWLVCGSNSISAMDLSRNTSLSNCFNLGEPPVQLNDMPSLYEICVWEGFSLLADYWCWDTTNSPNVYFTTECTIGIEEQEFDNILIYPNPTSNFITIEAEHQDRYSIEINSLNGQLLLYKEMEAPTHQLDLSTFKSGIYFITIRSKDCLTTRRIIKM